ncbi:MAG: RNA polymerase factor sigma-54 [Acidobacteria bacterium]|nr:RNA polymerase factor sigma-54 [Acidobacteriota bacterium]MBV9144927.1 RNA polymerase factor sigma-54 [Acidobacteriota bacterium]MBV9437570.1 RNA polymerase factor sigma-54 [Acidobacteriota bacterium]
MVLLQNKLNLKVSQKQILTPGLVQMVSVLALNKLELKEMINEEIVENPVLEELESNIPIIDQVAGKEEDRDRPEAPDQQIVEAEKKDPFEEIDFGTYFKDYLDPGFRSPHDFESSEKPSFENFLSKPGTLTDHLMWQLGAMNLCQELRAAAEFVIGNLNDDGYLVASDEELMSAARGEVLDVIASGSTAPTLDAPPDSGVADLPEELYEPAELLVGSYAGSTVGTGLISALDRTSTAAAVAPAPPSTRTNISAQVEPPFTLDQLREGISIIQQLDPIGVAAHDLRECLLLQLRDLETQINNRTANGNFEALNRQLAQIQLAMAIVDTQLRNVQNRQYKDIARGTGRPLDAVMEALDFLKTLDPKPGQRYNQVEPRLIEPDVAFVKQSDEYVVMMNEDDIPVLRLNPGYKKLLNKDAAEKDVRNYVKERYKSAIQLMKNIEQRKQTILKTCYAIIGRQREFLDHGIDHLKPMMIKEVAEEIGVHPSTVSRAVANKYVHTPQGVYELRYFFSESVNGPEGSGTSLMILKRRVKKLIEEEDARRPLTDEQITRILQSQGINVTRRTVAKYREDMKIPSTHQRRVKD